MPTHKLVALFLALVAAADFLLGFFLVEPRLPVEKRPVIRKVFLLGMVLMLGLATAFWFGLIPAGE